MPNIVPITYNNFSDKKWLRPNNMLFAKDQSVCALTAAELPKACMSLVIAFARSNESVFPVALLGLSQNSNLYVTENGRWQGHYIPARYRAYPFSIMNDAENKQILCFDRDSGLLVDQDSSGQHEGKNDNASEDFFADKDKPSDALTNVMKLVSSIYSNQILTADIGKLLQKYDLITPWKIEVENSEGNKTAISDLLKIDEKKLGALAAEELYELNQLGALSSIYCQLLSMQHLNDLSNYFKNKSAKPQTMASELNLDGTDSDGNISFDNL